MNKIYIDLDGVCVDFIGSAAKLFGMTKEELMPKWKPGLWDMSEVVGLSHAEFFKKLEEGGEDFWADMELYPWADELYESCKKLAPTYFLTMPTGDPRCLSGKLKMLHRWHGHGFSDYVMTKHKDHCANSHTILIDDHDLNVEKFKKSGGHAILFPAHTNANHIHKHEALEWTKGILNYWQASVWKWDLQGS